MNYMLLLMSKHMAHIFSYIHISFFLLIKIIDFLFDEIFDYVARIYTQAITFKLSIKINQSKLVVLLL